MTPAWRGKKELPRPLDLGPVDVPIGPAGSREKERTDGADGAARNQVRHGFVGVVRVESTSIDLAPSARGLCSSRSKEGASTVGIDISSEMQTAAHSRAVTERAEVRRRPVGLPGPHASALTSDGARHPSTRGSRDELTRTGSARCKLGSDQTLTSLSESRTTS